MFERYTERARRVLFFSRYEASQFGSIAIQPDHLLLGLLREGGHLDAMFGLTELQLEALRQAIEQRADHKERIATSVEIPFDAAAKRVLQFTAEEADRLLHNYIGAEHLVLGILREGTTTAAAALIEQGLALDTARARLQQALWTTRQGPSSSAVHSHCATGTFDVKLLPLETHDRAEGSLLGRRSIDKRFYGDLQGTSVGEMLSAGTATKGSAGYVAIERVTGTLAGRSGTFILQHFATMTRGTPHLNIIVVPDSGTGELTGLTGSMSITVDPQKHAYEFHYTLPAQ